MRTPGIDVTSLLVRLIMILSATLLAGLIASIALIVAGARGRIQAEAQSGIRVGAKLLTDALSDISLSPDPERAYSKLIADLPRVRHVTFASGAAARERPSDLLTRLLAPAPLKQAFSVTAEDGCSA